MVFIFLYNYYYVESVWLKTKPVFSLNICTEFAAELLIFLWFSNNDAVCNVKCAVCVTNFRCFL